MSRIANELGRHTDSGSSYGVPLDLVSLHEVFNGGQAVVAVTSCRLKAVSRIVRLDTPFLVLTNQCDAPDQAKGVRDPRIETLCPVDGVRMGGVSGQSDAAFAVFAYK